MAYSDRLPLEELNIDNLYVSDKGTYEVPIYQRNYAWDEDQIKTLVNDVYDAYRASVQAYYIGTLVVYNRGDKVYEVIDGQQRLTTIFLILTALGIKPQNKLTYKARKKSKDTLEHINMLEEVDERDAGIVNGLKFARNAIYDIDWADDELAKFKNYFLRNVHIVRYQVPKDVDLNHYFEVMNSRGEQLEKHEIVKAMLSRELREKDIAKFSQIWEACSEMNVYVQQRYPEQSVFGKHLNQYPECEFDDLPESKEDGGKLSLRSLINGEIEDVKKDENRDKNDSFEPIIDFPNFLLIVLKITRMDEPNFVPTDFTLDDKELINEFKEVKITKAFVKTFATNLLKAKFLLDNYIVHHTTNREVAGDNPWKLQTFYKKDEKNRYVTNVAGDGKMHDELVHLLSMFEVSFSPRQRKNYLFYCIYFLFGEGDEGKYLDFLRTLAKKYFMDVYQNQNNLSESNNRPVPNSFDNMVLAHGDFDLQIHNKDSHFVDVYGDGSAKSKGIQLFIFNYMDYKLWKKYNDEMRGKKYKKNSAERVKFFNDLGCSDFELDFFDSFYFSRTRKSLEHFYPQAKIDKKTLSEDQINCFGNFAMIGDEANSSGSDWDPKEKVLRYGDRKSDPISVASLKFKIMMQICSDNEKKILMEKLVRNSGLEWNYEDIKEHQKKMLEILYA